MGQRDGREDKFASFGPRDQNPTAPSPWKSHQCLRQKHSSGEEAWWPFRAPNRGGDEQLLLLDYRAEARIKGVTYIYIYIYIYIYTHVLYYIISCYNVLFYITCIILHMCNYNIMFVKVFLWQTLVWPQPLKMRMPGPPWTKSLRFGISSSA